MTDKDKEAFKKWMQYEDRHDGVFGNNNNFTRDEWIADKAWQAACEYKQKEIDELQAENAKLRLVVDHYAQADDVGAYARIILRELEKK